MVRAALVACVLVVACGEKEQAARPAGKQEAPPPAALDASPAPTPAKDPPAGGTSQADCAKIVEKQIAFETDAELEETMKLAKEQMVAACVDGTPRKQADCLLGAADHAAFDACLQGRF
jgi:hypothetical protein